MSVRPAKSVKLCNAPSANLFVQDEICLDDGAGVISEAMRFRTLDPLTLATIAERLVDTLTGLDAVGIPVACPCADDDATLSDLCAQLAALPMSGSNPLAATAFIGADCQKYTLAQLQAVVTPAMLVALRGPEQFDAFGVPLGYLLTP